MRILSILAIIALCSGCSNKLKQKAGLVSSGPNEYEVQKQKPLEVPPHYDLPPLGAK